MLNKIRFESAANCEILRPTASPDMMLFETDFLVASNTTLVSDGPLPVHRTSLSFTVLPVSLNDTHVGGGTLIGTFPEGIIRIHGAIAKAITPTTTSAILTTLNGSKTLSVGVGSVQTTTQDSGNLTTTEQNIVTAFSATSSATINVAGTAGNGYGPGAHLILDGHTSAAAVYLNVGVPTATDIDGDATITVSGTVTLFWSYLGDY